MDNDIIIRIKKGDRDAFDRFCRSCYAGLVSYAGLFVRDSWAEDVVQDVLFGIWQHRFTLKNDPVKVKAYMIRSVYNRCMNYIKSEKRRSGSLSVEDAKILDMMSGYYSPDKNPVILGIFNAELSEIIDAALARLTPRCREVFCMSYLEDLPDKEIAGKLGLSVRTVENHIQSALRQLRTELADVSK